MEIDDTTYDKAAKHPPRWGYQSRGGVVPSSVLIHTTNNRRKTSFQHEATFLLDSGTVSAHYLIGKDGTIVQFLSPLKWQAWHAGNCTPPYLNPRSIGIEHHVSVGETWTRAQHAACTELVQSLMRAYGISNTAIETHRAVALPKGRKSDPTGWDDAAFYRWRATLAPVSLPHHTVTAGPHGAMAQEDRRPGALAAKYYPPGTKIVCDDLQESYWHAADHSGFIPVGHVQA